MEFIPSQMKKRLTLVLVILGILITGRAILGRLTSFSQESSSLSPTPSYAQVSVSNIPAGLPEDFPVYPGSEFISMTVSDNAKGRSFIWHSKESSNLVYEYLKSSLKIKNYSVTNTSEIGNSFALSFEKDEFKGFLAVLKDSSGKTVVSATIGSRRP